MEAHVSETVSVSEHDIDRIERAIKANTDISQVFPRLMTLASNGSGEGPTIKVKITKKQGAPVRYISGDDPTSAAAIREVDMRKKYHISPSDLATRLGMNTTHCKALRKYLEIYKEKSNLTIFEFGSQQHPRYSDNALRIMNENNKPDLIEKALKRRVDIKPNN